VSAGLTRGVAHNTKEMYSDVMRSIKPAYSAWDQYQDLMHGRITSFKTYKGEEMHFSPWKSKYRLSTKIGERWIRATFFYPSCMTDLQGYAAALIAEGKDLFFNKQGNFTNPY
jgi:hypothetical protein